MTQRYLILRCHPRDTLPLSLDPSLSDLSLLCPTTRVTIRSGPSRRRTQVTLPILPSFLFFPVYIPDPKLPNLPSRLHLMRRPYTAPSHPHVFNQNNPLPDKIPRSSPSSYAFCTLSDITRMTTHVADSPDSLDSTIRCGSQVEVTQGLLEGITGIVAQIWTNGDITLKVQEHLGWQINTCIVNASVLRLL